MTLGQVLVYMISYQEQCSIHLWNNPHIKHTYSDEVYECKPGSARRTKKVLSSWAATRSFRHRIFPWIMPWSSCLKNYRLALHATQLTNKTQYLKHVTTASITRSTDSSSKPDSSQALGLTMSSYFNFTKIMKVVW